MQSGVFVRLRSALTFGLALGFLLLPMGASAQQERSITTQGHGEIKARPDAVAVQVTVESRNSTLAETRADNNRKTQAIIAALKGLNIPNLKLETRNISVYPIQAEGTRGKLAKIIGYQATNSLHVGVLNAEPDALGDYASRIMDTSLNAGANNVGGLNFYLSDLSPVRAKALEMAVKDARNNAQAMARAADVSLTGVYSLEGFPQFSNYPMATARTFMKAEAAGADSAPAAPVETGETTVTSDVTARFKF